MQVQKQKMKQTDQSISVKRPLLQMMIALALFSITVIASKNTPMADWEVTAFYWIYNLPETLRPLFFIITQSGTIYAVLLVVIILAFLRKTIVTACIIIACFLAFQLSGVAKGLWGRPRPLDVLENVVNRDWTVYGPGFPSGHVALGTALALTIFMFAPRRFRWVILVFITLLALSRIYLGIHAPLDVIGGFAIGWFCAIGATAGYQLYLSKLAKN